MPMAGDVVMYTADNRNIHSVDEITEGERLTLTLWFSRDNSHDEDAKLVSILSRNVDSKPDLYIPLSASICMYWFPPNQSSQYQSGFDIRWARLLALGFDLYSSHESSSVLSLSDRISELPMEPLQMAREDELLEDEFANIMHVLQVLQFYHWKAPELQTPNVIRETCNMVVQISNPQREKINCLRSIFIKDHRMAETIFNVVTCGKNSQLLFDWANISAAVAAWDEYTLLPLAMELGIAILSWWWLSVVGGEICSADCSDLLSPSFPTCLSPATTTHRMEAMALCPSRRRLAHPLVLDQFSLSLPLSQRASHHLPPPLLTEQRKFSDRMAASSLRSGETPADRRLIQRPFSGEPLFVLRP